MAIRARVELRGSLTHQGRGRFVKQGEPFYITNPADVAYYQAQSGFSVDVLADNPPAKPAKSAKPPPPPPEDEGEAEAEGVEAEDEPDAEDSGPPSINKTDLEKMNKGALVDLAEAMFGLELDANMPKPKMVGAILAAQIKALQAED